MWLKDNWILRVNNFLNKVCSRKSDRDFKYPRKGEYIGIVINWQVAHQNLKSPFSGQFGVSLKLSIYYHSNTFQDLTPNLTKYIIGK